MSPGVETLNAEALPNPTAAQLAALVWSQQVLAEYLDSASLLTTTQATEKKKRGSS